jgi:hypothetical protein
LAGKGRKIDFKNTIIIMTSNLGAESLVTDVDQEGIVSDSAKTEVMHSVRQAFAPEFVNRIDEMVYYFFFFNHVLFNSSHLLSRLFSTDCLTEPLGILLTLDSEKWSRDLAIVVLNWTCLWCTTSEPTHPKEASKSTCPSSH